MLILDDSLQSCKAFIRLAMIGIFSLKTYLIDTNQNYNACIHLKLLKHLLFLICRTIGGKLTSAFFATGPNGYLSAWGQTRDSRDAIADIQL